MTANWVALHWLALIALSFTLAWLAYVLNRCRKQFQELRESIRQSEQVLAYYAAPGKPHLKLSVDRISAHLRRSFDKHRANSWWTLEINESMWCQENLSKAPEIVSVDHTTDVYLVFASDNDAFAFKMRWF